MYAQVDILIHATEDGDRILKSFLRLFGIKEYKLFRYDLTGHYKNPLTLYKLRIRGIEARKLLENILKKLDEVDREYLFINLDEYIDRRKFYLRLEKNSICIGKVRLVNRDPIKIVFYNIDKDVILSYS